MDIAKVLRLEMIQLNGPAAVECMSSLVTQNSGKHWFNHIWTPPVLQANRVDGFWYNCFRISGFLLGSVNFPSHNGFRA